MRFFTLLFILVQVLVLPAQGQQISIELGKSPLPINQYYTVSIRLQNQPLKDYTPFPEIEGFKKSSRYSTTKTITTAGETTTILTITQNYAALDEGDFTLRPFTMKVNGQTVQSPGASIKIVPAPANGPQSINLPDLNALNETTDPVVEQEPEFISKEDNAFLTIYTNKKEVFVGEGVNVVLYFYLAEKDQQLLDFHDFANQLTGIVRQLKQPNSWEEAFDFTEITPENVLVKGEPYLRFKFYEAVLYPLNLEPVRFPALELRMIKYKVAKNPNLLEEDRQEGFKTFYSREKVVGVKQLPPHPLRDVVPVGVYSIQQKLSARKVPVGKSFNYQFTVTGEGNFDALMPPVPANPIELDFYPPDVRQDITRRNGQVVGAKTFAYNIMPREPGTFKLADALGLIYFNPETAAYDTLRPTVQVQVTGLQDTDALVLSRDLGDFYNIIENEDTKLQSLNQANEIRRYANIVLVVLLAVGTFVFLKKNKV
ncbi:BatD family protein [Pontibacter arcticus]|nr:BatD family protein [Pontibacter arcticus]